VDRLQLATLLSWAGEGGFRGRKRLQKVVFFLQEAGCSLDCRFILHNYGPYSRDVADACDEIVAAGLVDESYDDSSGYVQYTYSLTQFTRELLQRTPDPRMQRFEAVGRGLINEDLRTLELGSTILFFFRQCKNWDEALEGACKFKKVSQDTSPSLTALKLARRIEAWASN